MEIREINGESECGYDDSYVTYVSEFRWCGKKFIIPRANRENTSLVMQFKRRNEIVNDMCTMQRKTWKEKNSNQNILSSGKQYLLPDGRRDCTDLNDIKNHPNSIAALLFRVKRIRTGRTEFWSKLMVREWHRDWRVSRTLKHPWMLIHLNWLEWGSIWWQGFVQNKHKRKQRSIQLWHRNEWSMETIGIIWHKLPTVANADFHSMVTRVVISYFSFWTNHGCKDVLSSLRSDHVPRMSPRICHVWNGK